MSPHGMRDGDGDAPSGKVIDPFERILNHELARTMARASRRRRLAVSNGAAPPPSGNRSAADFDALGPMDWAEIYLPTCQV